MEDNTVEIISFKTLADCGVDVSDDGNSSDTEKPAYYKYKSKKRSVGKIVLCRAGAFVYSSDMDNIRTLKNWFTIKTKIRRNTKFFKTICDSFYKPSRGYTRVPRFGIFNRLSDISNVGELNMANPTIDNQIICTGKLLYSQPRDFREWEAELSHNQQITTKWLMENVYTPANEKRGSAGCIVKMPTGTGKTYMGASIIREIGGPVLIICRDSGDCEQWVRTLNGVFPEIRIGEYHGVTKSDGDIIVSVVNSIYDSTVFKYRIFNGHPLYSRKVTGITEDSVDFMKRFKLIIWDEAHTYCSKSGVKAFMKAQAPYMLGLSATPNDRPDKFDPIAHWNIGQVVDATKLDGYKHDDIVYKCKVKVIDYEGHPDYIKPITANCQGQIVTSTTLMIKQFATDPYRLQLICKQIESLYKKGHNTVVFADRKEYLDIISQALTVIKSIKATIMIDDSVYDSVKTLVGGAKSNAISDATLAGRIILTTYAYFGTGKSIKRLNAIIFATPRKSHVNQFIGRIFRKGSDNTIRRRVIDIVDCKTSLKSQYYARKVIYDMQNSLSRKTKICKVKIPWTKFASKVKAVQSDPKQVMPEDKLRSIITKVLGTQTNVLKNEI